MAMNCRESTYPEVLVLFAYLPLKVGTDFYTTYYTRLPLPMQAKLSHYYRQEDQLAGIIGKNLLRYGLNKLGIASSVLEAIQYTASSRPYLPLFPKIDFNISHSGSLVTCAISLTVRVGIDVEREKEVAIIHFQSSFSSSQWQMLENAANPQKLFYQLWVQKEALVKADGLSQAICFTDIDIKENMSSIHKRRWFLSPLAINPLYCAWLATDCIGNILTEQVFF